MSDPSTGTPQHNPGFPRETQPFVWPPSPPSPGATTDAPRPAIDPHHARVLEARFRDALARPRTRSVQVLDDCEDHWLDLTHPSLARRVQDAAWSPDLPGAYCPRCGVTCGPHGADALGCAACQDRRMPFERMVRLGSFEDLLRDAIHQVKFESWRSLGGRLGDLLGIAVAHELSARAVDPSSVVIVPMPTTFRRRMSRGIDHALILARAVQARTGGVLLRPIAKRHRPSQVEVNPSERAQNMARAFRPRRPALAGPRGADRWPEQLCGKVVIVVDDVMTTGATLRGACRAIQAAARAGRENRGSRPPGPRIWAAVLGVTPAPGARAGREAEPRGRGGPEGPKGREAGMGESEGTS